MRTTAKNFLELLTSTESMLNEHKDLCDDPVTLDKVQSAVTLSNKPPGVDVLTCGFYFLLNLQKVLKTKLSLPLYPTDSSPWFQNQRKTHFSSITGDQLVSSTMTTRCWSRCSLRDWNSSTSRYWWNTVWFHELQTRFQQHQTRTGPCGRSWSLQWWGLDSVLRFL